MSTWMCAPRSRGSLASKYWQSGYHLPLLLTVEKRSPQGHSTSLLTRMSHVSFWPTRHLRQTASQDYFDMSHAAEIRHNVIMIEKTIGMTNRYLQLTTVMAAKERANAHAMPRMS